ncbi:MAG: acyl-CoA dehydratase activase-related protein [Bacillota bacterium]|nr:acyl-CoA dehydratase activase-related protein [Bacillota bacterium]
MRLGIPRGYFYYDYYLFIETLFHDSETELVFGEPNNEEIMQSGIALTVDEACLPIKLMAGQVSSLINDCDIILIPRIMKDLAGRWLCPKLLGLPELMTSAVVSDKIYVTEPVHFNNKNRTRECFWKLCRKTGMKRTRFNNAFEKAFGRIADVYAGRNNMHVEASWEFIPEEPGPDEILLPNTVNVLLAGHCYNIYDKFTNFNIMKKLDTLGIGAMTEGSVPHSEMEICIKKSGLIKEPFWEAFVRILGTALYMRDKVDGILYLSSFSCGLDAMIIEMLKSRVSDLPIMVVKIDEHRGEAGLDTRLEAFADLLEKRRVS